LRRSLSTLERLRAGWRPDDALLAGARRLERWAVVRRDDSAYQFVGYAVKSREVTSMIIATSLAIDPVARWALLFADTWIVLGDQPSPSSPIDPADVTTCAQAWLRREMALVSGKAAYAVPAART
jgi:hypothetical protein